VLLVIPAEPAGLSGMKEAQAIEELLAHGIPLNHTETMCRLVLLGILPALKENDLKSFGESLSDLNYLAGQVFAQIPGGAYRPRVAQIIQFIQRQGISGVGQSSWGPAVFTVIEDTLRARDLSEKIRKTFNLNEKEVLVTSACNHGATANVIAE